MFMCVLNMPLLLLFCFTEIEAKEACDWLRAAGFPQYAQLYEGNTHTQSSQHLVSCLVSHKDLPPSNLSLLSLTLVFSIIYASLFFLPSLHLPIPVLWATAFYFQASVPVRGRGHGKGLVISTGTLTASLSLFFLPPFSLHPVLSSPTTFLPLIPAVKACIFFLSVFLSSFLPSVLPSFWLSEKASCDDHQVSYSWGTNRKWPQ